MKANFSQLFEGVGDPWIPRDWLPLRTEGAACVGADSGPLAFGSDMRSAAFSDVFYFQNENKEVRGYEGLRKEEVGSSLAYFCFYKLFKLYYNEYIDI